jgi:ParB family chromosome partitioning protein
MTSPHRPKAMHKKSTRKTRPQRPKLVDIEDIKLGNAGRRVDDAKVAQLATSISDQGLRYPIQLYRLKMPRGKYGLAAGQHRLAAFRKLGRRKIPAVILKRAEAKAWRASENLHRSALSALQKSIDIVAYAQERLKLPNVERRMKGGRQPHDRGYSKLARVLNMSRRRIERAHQHVALPSSVKKLIIKRRDLNKLATLDKVAKIKSEEDQLQYLQRKGTIASPRDRAVIQKTEQKVSRPLDLDETRRLSKLKVRWEKSGLLELYAHQTKRVQTAFLNQIAT